MKICIDPGHGQNTSGKRSPDGTLREYEFNRDVARRLKGHLERHGITVIYSCDIDTPVDVSRMDRCRRANSAKADLFISIHANAHKSDWTEASGWEIYYFPGSNKGRTLAEAIHKASVPALGIKDRGVKTARYDVIHYTDMPAVLIEHGFYTNKAECELLKTAEFREKCAVADAKGILSYLGVAWKDGEADTSSTASTTPQSPVGDSSPDKGSLGDTSSTASGSPSPQGECKIGGSASGSNVETTPRSAELVTPNDIVWQLGEWGIVTDPEGMLKEMEENPNGRLYWLARKVVNRMCPNDK